MESSGGEAEQGQSRKTGGDGQCGVPKGRRWREGEGARLGRWLHAESELLGPVTARWGSRPRGCPWPSLVLAQLRKGARALPGLKLKLHFFPKLPHTCQFMQEF